jgi:hypothetical protein
MQKPVPAAPGAASTVPTVKYYIARLLSEHGDPLSALMRYGFPEERAQLLIAEASLNRSEAIVVGFEGEHGQLAVAPHGARWHAWWAIPEYFDTEAEALAAGEEVARQLAPKKITWGVFSYVTAPSMGSRQ